MKEVYESEFTFIEQNTNPRSMKRFPTVKKRKCNYCEKHFSISDVDLDHIKGESTLKTLDHIPEYIENILGSFKTDLQWLCNDKIIKSTKTFYLGCHGIKTLAERNNISFKEALAHKIFLFLKNNKIDKKFFTDRNLDIPSNEVKRRKAIVDILLKEEELPRFLTKDGF